MQLNNMSGIVCRSLFSCEAMLKILNRQPPMTRQSGLSLCLEGNVRIVDYEKEEEEFPEFAEG